jgi:predicted nucleotidyltransferase
MGSVDPDSRDFAAAHHAAKVYLDRLRGTHDVAGALIFGSRARGDHRPDSDLDLAVILNGQRSDLMDTRLDMAGIAFDVMMETGILVQPFPVSATDIEHPERFANPPLIRKIVEEGIRLRW